MSPTGSGFSGSRTVNVLAVVVFAAIALTAAMLVWRPGAADASPRFPGDGDRISVTFTSDRQWNEAATWYDSSNRFRYQRDLPLSVRDPKTALWSATMVYTSRVHHQNVDVTFTSTGRYARCRVTVNGVGVRTAEVRGRFATARCR